MPTYANPAARGRKPVTLVHVLKKKLRTVLSPSSADERHSASSPAGLSSRSSSATSSSSDTPPSINTSAVQRYASNVNGEENTQTSATAAAATPTTAHRTEARRTPRPEALPAPNFYKEHPKAVGPVANVVISSQEEYRLFLMTARPITVVLEKRDRRPSKNRFSQEDIEKGGFFVYRPHTAMPRYFLLHKRASDVYGTSTYKMR